MNQRNSLWIIVLSLCALSFLCQLGEVEANNQPRIINGQEVKWNSTRYQVSIRMEEIDRYFFGVGHLCGGTIIARHAILTSAHCIWNANSNSFYPASKFSVVLGNLDRSLFDANTRKFSVSKIITAPNFNSSTFRDDLAIIFLSQPIPENFTRAEIMEINENINIKDGTVCQVTGWGLTEKQTYTRNLMMIEVPIINRTICSINYGREIILDGMLCAGYMSGKSDACSGDSGGPLVYGDKLVGIVSFGFGCAMPGYPGVYTNVAYYYHWIKGQAGLTNKNYEFDSNANVTIISFSNTANIFCSNLFIICLLFWYPMKFIYYL